MVVSVNFVSLATRKSKKSSTFNLDYLFILQMFNHLVCLEWFVSLSSWRDNGLANHNFSSLVDVFIHVCEPKKGSSGLEIATDTINMM